MVKFLFYLVSKQKIQDSGDYSGINYPSKYMEKYYYANDYCFDNEYY